MRPALHFVLRTGASKQQADDPDRFHRAARIFGPPDFVHPLWDMKAVQEIVKDLDTVVFFNGTEEDVVSFYPYTGKGRA